MAISSASTPLSPGEGYRLWANTYDREPNPMLSLERRILEPLLPGLAGLDVLDLGCGTGRWLEILRGAGARSLMGVDCSREMLQKAQSKLGSTTTVIHSDCSNLNLGVHSADLILCNFVLSYLQDCASFLKDASLLLRPGGSLFVTDLHPETSVALHWRRGPNSQGEFRKIRTYAHSIADILAACQKANLLVSAFLQPRFGEQEQVIFERSNKVAYFEVIRELPPIYILQLTATKSAQTRPTPQLGIGSQTVIRGARVALDASVVQPVSIRIVDQFIDALVDEHLPADRIAKSSDALEVDLTGHLVLPGFINAHDHLEFALFPRLGRGGYQNFLEWVDDIYHPVASPIAEHRRVPRNTRFWWGGIRNLLCGVTTVCHHNPYEAGVFTEEFPVRVLRDYGWAHSMALDSEVSQKKRTTPEGRPFFVHLAEGTDASSSYEIYSLHQACALDSNTVVIHGLGMDSNGRALFRASRAGLVWCPTSNVFLFGKTLSAAEVRRFPRVALGSDSPLTAAGDLLDEVHYARNLSGASSVDLYGYVTGRAADILCLRNGEGRLLVGGVADMIAVRDKGLTPAETLVSLSYCDIELVLIAGRVQLASPGMKERLPSRYCDGLQPLLLNGVRRWIRAPLASLFADTIPHLGQDVRLGGRRVSLGN